MPFWSTLFSKPSQKTKFLCAFYLHKLYLLCPFRGHLKVPLHLEAACGSVFLQDNHIFLSVLSGQAPCGNGFDE